MKRARVHMVSAAILGALLVMAACTAPLPSATSAGFEQPIHLTATGSVHTQTFRLQGGDYTFAWTAPRAGTAACFRAATLISADSANHRYEIVSPGVTDLAASVTVRQPGIAAGSYYLDVSSECAWQIDVTAIR